MRNEQMVSYFLGEYWWIVINILNDDDDRRIDGSVCICRLVDS